jgi:transposase
VEEIDRAGHQAQLAHALTAKRRMEGRHKTDERDARGLAMLLRNGTLPRVWIPPAELRDQREMLRWRMSLVESRSQVKNRIHGVLLRYNVAANASDLFGDAGRAERKPLLAELPEWTRQSVHEQMETIDHLDQQIADCEQKLESLLEASAERDLLKTRAEPGELRRISAGRARKRRQKTPRKMSRRLQHVSEVGLYRGRQRGLGAS